MKTIAALAVLVFLWVTSTASASTPLQRHLRSMPQSSLTPFGQALRSGLADDGESGIVSKTKADDFGAPSMIVPDGGGPRWIGGGWMYNQAAGSAVYYPYGFSVPLNGSWGSGGYALFVVGPGFYNGYGVFEHILGFYTDGPENSGMCPHPYICEVYVVAPRTDDEWRIRGIVFWASSNLFYFEYAGTF